jgi:MSHA pilin protein MshC
MDPRIPRSAPPTAGIRRSTRGAQAGFTLVELIIVILLLGVLSFSALPRLSESDEASAQGFVEQVATTLRWAQKTAVAQRRVVYVNLDASTGRVRACLDASNACAQPVAAPATGALDVAAPARVSLTSAVTQFSFDGLGRPSLAANLEIRSTTSRGDAFAIVVERDSGYVRRL